MYNHWSVDTEVVFKSLTRGSNIPASFVHTKEFKKKKREKRKDQRKKGNKVPTKLNSKTPSINLFFFFFPSPSLSKGEIWGLGYRTGRRESWV